MNNIQQMLQWIKNRCLFKYKETPGSQTIWTLDQIYENYSTIESCNIPQECLDSIIGKYYFDFAMDKTPNSDGLSIGFSDADRMVLRHNIINIYKDIVAHILAHKISPKTTPQTTVFDNENVIDFACHHVEEPSI